MKDVIVVGSGAGGISCAYALAKHGLSVLCIDQGPDIDSDIMSDMKKGGEYDKFSVLSSNPKERSDETGYPINSLDSPIDIHNLCALGGSTLLFSAQYPRLRRCDFEYSPVIGCVNSWPISYEDILPYYQINEQLSGLSGKTADPKNENVYPVHKPVPLGAMGERLAAGFESLGWHWWPAYSALPLSSARELGLIRPTNIDIGENKGSAKTTYLTLCRRLGVEFMTSACVVRINADSSEPSMVSGVTIKREGEAMVELRSRYVVVAAGGIGTPRLLLQSKSKAWPFGIGNRNNRVGSGLMLHPWGYVEGLFEEDLESIKGPQGCCLLSQEHYEYEAGSDECGGFTLQGLRGPWPYESAKTWINRKKVSFGKSMYKELLSYHNRTAHLAVIVDDKPDTMNKVVLDESRRDRYGMFGVAIKYQITEESRMKLAHGINSGKRVLKSAGAVKTIGFGPVRNTGWHTLGTCAMGDSEKNGVTDKDGKVFGVSNLYVSDASLISRGGSVNPANTIQALGLYVGDRIGKIASG